MHQYNRDLLKSQVIHLYPDTHLIPLQHGSKSPAGKWGIKKPTLQSLIAHIDSGGNIGMICGDLLVIDVDDHDGSGTGKKSFRRLQSALDRELTINVQTPSGGHHTYIQLPDGLGGQTKTRLGDYPNVDFLHGKRYVLIAGCETQAGEYKLLDDTIVDSPPHLLTLLQRDIVPAATDFDDFARLRTETKADVLQLLTQHDPNCGYHHWIQVGMALHDWDDLSGFNIWAQWSERAQKPATRKQMKSHWRSFGNSENPVTLSSLYPAKRKSIPNADNDQDAWIGEWVWVGPHKKFYNIRTGVSKEDRGFNLLLKGNVPPDEKGRVRSAVTYFTNHPDAIGVDGLMYDPASSERLIYDDGRVMLNTFIADSATKAVAELSGDGKLYIKQLLVPHINFLAANSPEHTGIILQFIAHIIQHPGELIRWGVLIQGDEGIGKSYLGALLRAVLGRANVRVVPAEQVVSTYRLWASGAQVCVLEELRLSGKNRYTTLDALKPFVTDDYVRVEDKYISSYEVKNTTNYICFTNHKDSLPLSDSDRRWFVLFAPSFTSMSDSSDAYFEALYNGLDRYAADLRHYFETYTISTDFYGYHRAPMTDAKSAMIASESAEHHLDDLRDLITEGGDGYCTGVVCVEPLFEQFSARYPSLDIRQHERYTKLKRLGYTACKNPVRWRKRRVRVWTDQIMSTAEIQDAMVAGWVRPNDEVPQGDFLDGWPDR